MQSSLGYKIAVERLYERKLAEARAEAQQSPQYIPNGDVSIIGVIMAAILLVP